MENGRHVVGSVIRPRLGAIGPPLRVNIAYPVETSISILRELALAGYFNDEQLSAMELVLRKETDAAESRHHWLTIAEACRYARISRTTLWRYSQEGLILIRKLNGRRLVDRQELESLIVAKSDEPKFRS